MEKKIDLLGLCFDNYDRQELEVRLRELLLSSAGQAYLVTPNPEIVMRASNDRDYAYALSNAELCIADGVGIKLASDILGAGLRCRIPGIEIGETVLSLCAENSLSVFMLGGSEGVAHNAALNMTKRYAGLRVVGTRHGYFSDDELVVDEIDSLEADVLFVCLGSPRQELWLSRNIHRLKSVKLALALGGSLDVYAGKVRRAPVIFRKLGLEWLYRGFLSFDRFKRMLRLPLFIKYVYKAKQNMKRTQN
ncbi:MAG: WecB/TagA/CpsF family glycosyltransferase [Clostridia bacterium]|nr:WecB/TagA/CpsF family glycosyltransferase [Clostridia bacterium]